MKSDLHNSIEQTLLNEEGYILITCGKPKRDGTMNVEMSYGGDSGLVSYLLNNAQAQLDEEMEEEEENLFLVN